MTAKKAELTPAAGSHSTELQKSGETKASPSIRFTEKVLSELQSEINQPVQMTAHQKKIIQNAFVKLDMILKTNEQKRLAKKEEYRDSLAFTWENVNMNKLAQDIAAVSSVGLDPLQKNHVHLVPYKNDKIGKYDFEPIIGYRGTEIKALKFGLDIPSDIVVELVYETDHFIPLKKNLSRDIESYEFEITSPFDRGDIVGGFYYHMYKDQPQKNKLVIMSISNILKRKPDYASAEFWGGQKDEWKNGKKTGNKTEVEGWYDEMCFKTVFRAAHDAITIDSEKISKHLAEVIQMENSYLYGEDKRQDSISNMRSEVNSSAASGKTIKIKNVEEAVIDESPTQENAMTPNEDFGKEDGLMF